MTLLGQRTRTALRSKLVRNADIAVLQDAFLVAAVSTVLLIRFQLWLTNYPQISPGNLHIAHLLWGGFFMLIAIGMLLSFVGRGMRKPAAIIGGVGFGFFIDELGKFITADNNYFYKPAAALIYLVFVALFLLARSMQRRRELTPRESLMNAADLVLEMAQHDFNQKEKTNAIALLGKADQSDPLVSSLRELIISQEAKPDEQPSWFVRTTTNLRARYFELTKRPRFRTLLGGVFMLWAVVSLLQVLALALDLSALIDPEIFKQANRVSDDSNHISIWEWGGIVSSLIAAGFVWVGVLRLRRNRDVSALVCFDRALMVQIFLTEVFEFLQDQFFAVFGLAVNILLLITVRYMIESEKLSKQLKEQAAGQETQVTAESQTVES